MRVRQERRSGRIDRAKREHGGEVRHASIPELRMLVHSRAELDAGGTGSRAIDRALADRTLIRIRRGWFIAAEEWTGLWPESRHRAHVLAVALSARGASPVFSHVSAAALWGIPLWRMMPERVHVLAGSVDRHSIPDVLRHEGRLPGDDVTERDGLRLTSLTRTAYDIARTLSPEAGIAAVDAAVALLAGAGRAFDPDAAARVTEDLRRRVMRPGARGIRIARQIVELADGRAQLPLESVARLQLTRMGFARPDVQVAVRAPGGGNYFVDLGLDDVGAFCEVDGETKYLDDALRSGRTLEQVLLAEKQREDWIRGTTQRPLARVGAEHVASPSAFARRLASFHIRPPR